jgi:NAD(P)-dependent dehydrogenase (short-subunit alcohol dehydrogenase family)
MEVFRLDGETALITGGGTGLGLGIARCMAAAGARVVIVGRREDVLQESITELGDNASYEVFDVTDVKQAPALVQRVEQRHGPVSILVNNAGIHLKKPALETTEDELLQVFNTHVTGAFALTRAVAPGMVERRHGSILFTASMASLFGIPKVVAYTAAKAAYLGLVNSLTSELSSSNVRVNAIAPGWIDSPMMRAAVDSDPERKAKILGRTPMCRFGQPGDVGWAAVYLCSPAAAFVTGVVLPVDGGASIGF